MFAKATTVYEAAAVCDPDLALEAGDPRYIDLSLHRGTDVVQQLYRAIRVKEEAVVKGIISRDQGFAKLLLTGLRGAGKTTELNRLCGLLEREGYFPLLISGVRELDLERLTHTELLMSLLWALQDARPVGPFRIQVPRRADEELNLALASTIVEAKDKESAEVKLQTEFGVTAGVPFYLKVKMGLRSMLAASTERSRTVKAQIFQRTSTFLTTLNHILDEVQADLRERGCKGLVFLIDELDRLPPRKAEDFPELTIPQLLFDLQSPDLKAPRAHVLYTFPSQLLVSVNLGKSWSERPLFIPAVRIFDRSSGEAYGPGREALMALVGARVDIDQVFSPPAGLQELILFGGGYARDLLRLVRYAANRTDNVIGAAEIHGAKRDLVAEYDRLLTTPLLEPLLRVDRERRLPPDPEFGELLERNLVLTYWNDEEWAHLHPAVRETPGYRAYRTPATG